MPTPDPPAIALPAGCAPESADLAGVLGHLVEVTGRILGGDRVGVYVQGSVALGAADRESDCDILVVVRRPLSASELDALGALHAEIPRRPGHWSRHLEGSYPVAGELVSLAGIGAGWAYVDHGSTELQAHSTHANTPVTRRILRDHGLTLAGPPAPSLVAPVPDDVIRAYSREQLTSYLDAAVTWQAKDAWSQRYVVATIARLMCSVETGAVVSKPAGVEWARLRLGSRWTPLLRAMIAARGSTAYDAPADPAWVDEAAAFAEVARGWALREGNTRRGRLPRSVASPPTAPFEAGSPHG